MESCDLNTDTEQNSHLSEIPMLPQTDRGGIGGLENWGCSSVVEELLSLQEALGSVHSAFSKVWGLG